MRHSESKTLECHNLISNRALPTYHNQIQTESFSLVFTVGLAVYYQQWSCNTLNVTAMHLDKLRFHPLKHIIDNRKAPYTTLTTACVPLRAGTCSTCGLSLRAWLTVCPAWSTPSFHSTGWLHYCWLFSRLSSTQQPFGVIAFSLGTFHTLGVALCWCLFHLHNPPKCTIRLIHHLAVERRCDSIWRFSSGSRDGIPQTFSELCFRILQAINNWR